ncbi:Helix-turn-helix domain-containing protein [Saccharopolyspora kobensis]|uniref:Helix-turn-helix domain-containing protein n=1 Tax=Saccharopolyspora kobensis TaxID=146035 RepID=A0A1H5WQN4_9PSEU|nr:Helix-turn-helix domain-containing protein [Saccharopolyspora kobensis]SFD78445.1 Helix-turn-helix domain-containing protein [Saccharopolyspora kobensis]
MDSWEAKALDSPLGVFLRARRQQVRPEQQGLVPGGSRQVAGLRRDEVAMLAGISTDYYVRLEQGRERHPSRMVLDGLSAALLLDRASSRYLRELAAADYDADVGGVVEPRRLDAVRPLLGSLTVPAILVDRWLNVVAANALGEMLHEGLEHRENYARMVFLSPGAQEFFVDWSELAHCMVAALRAGAGSESGSGRLERLVGELAVASEVFSATWAQHEVYEKAVDRKRLRHPLVGALAFDQHVLELPDSDGHRIWAYHPTDDATEEALVRLGSLATLSASTFTTREESTS